MSVYNNFIKEVESSKYSTINLAKGFAKAGKKIFIEDFKCKTDEELGIKNPNIDECLKLFDSYKHSKFGINSQSNAIYKALDLNELSDYDMINGEDRLIAQAKLEFYILAMIISNWKYPNPDKYFIKFDGYDGFYLLKEMFIKNNK